MQRILKSTISKLINTINVLWILAFIFIFSGILLIPCMLENKRAYEYSRQSHFIAKDMVVPLPENDWISELANPVIAQPPVITKAYELKYHESW